MLRRMLLLAVMLVLPAPAAWAQPPDVANALRAARAAYPTPMSKAQVSEFLNRVVAQFPGWGMLRKDAGNNCPTPMAVNISCDWIVNASARWGYDVLADSEGAATVVIGGGDALAAGAEVVFPWTTMPQPTPTPTPVPPPVGGVVTPDVIRAIVSSEVDRVYAQNERIFANVGDNLAAILGREDLLQAQLKAHDEKTNKFLAFFGDSKTITAIITAVSTLFVVKKGM